MSLTIENLQCGYGDVAVISGLSFGFDVNQVLTILGPNGIGKTTLFKTILGFLKPQSGRIEIDGKDISKLSKRQRARLLAYVPQTQIVPFAFSIEEFVLMGRAPYLGLLQQPKSIDRAIARDSLRAMGIEHLAKKSCTSVSGGELQLAFIARALTQQPRYLVLDEPTANLDYGNQSRVLERILDLAQDDRGVIMTTHNPEQAFILESQVILLQQSRDYISGSYNEVLTEARLHDTYNIDVLIRSFKHEERMVTSCRILPKCTCKTDKKQRRT